ncbi:MAG: 6-phospho-beta-glucosidase, partial [Candidatus Limnocylindrales bacterium]
FGTDTVGVLRGGVEPRSEFLLRQQLAFYASRSDTPQDALRTWRAARREREDHYFAEVRAAAGIGAHQATDATDAGGYELEAMDVVDAIVCDRGSVLVVNGANRGALPFLDDRAVVELPSRVAATGASPLPVGDVPPRCQALMTTIKAVDRLTIDAAITRSRRLAVEALALHPLVPSAETAGRIFDGYAAQQPELRGWSA